MRRLIRFLPALLVLSTASLVGCSAGSRALDEAYARGYSDGVDSVEQALIAVDKAYEMGYGDGLADAEEKANAELCQSCYGLGFSEGFQAGGATGGTGAGS